MRKVPERLWENLVTDKVDEIIIEAAGALLWTNDNTVKKLAIVHRISRYGDEWVLPKGKFDPEKDKNLKDTAIREIYEETGCEEEEITVGNFVGSTSYFVGDEPKVNLFWNMTSDKKCQFKESKEIIGIKWLPINEAISMLTYPKEKDLLRNSIVSSDLLESCKPSNVRRLRRIIKSSSHNRLQVAIPRVESQLNTLVELRINENAKQVSPWAEQSFRMVENAKHALRLCEIDLGWAFLNEAILLNTHLLSLKDGSLEATAQTTLNEAETKLSSWRKKAVQDLLGKNGILDSEFGKNESAYFELADARKILLERHDNFHRDRGVALFQLKILVIIAFFLTSSCIVSLQFINFAGTLELSSFPLLVSIILLGALGGTISSLMTVYKGSTESTIPDQILDMWFTISRPIFGSMAALALSVFFFAGLIQLGDLTIYVALVASFSAGFSERFFLSAVTRS